MNAREFLSLAPLLILCLWIGVRPGTLVALIQPDVQAVVDVIDRARVAPTEVATARTVGSFQGDLGAKELRY